MHNKITDLPVEIIWEICCFSNTAEIMKIALICKTFDGVQKNNNFWKELLQLHFRVNFTSKKFIKIPHKVRIKTVKKNESYKKRDLTNEGNVQINYPLNGQYVQVYYNENPNTTQHKKLYTEIFNINKKTFMFSLKLTRGFFVCNKNIYQSNKPKHVIFTDYLEYCKLFKLNSQTMVSLYKNSIYTTLIKEYKQNTCYMKITRICKNLPLPPKMTLKILFGIYQVYVENNAKKKSTNFFKNIIFKMSKKPKDYTEPQDNPECLPDLIGREVLNSFLDYAIPKLMRELSSNKNHHLYKKYTSYKEISSKLQQINSQKNSDAKEKYKLIRQKNATFHFANVFRYFPGMLTEMLDDVISNETELPPCFCTYFFVPFRNYNRKNMILNCIKVISESVDNFPDLLLSPNYLKLAHIVFTNTCEIECELDTHMNNKNAYKTRLSTLSKSDDAQQTFSPSI